MGTLTIKLRALDTKTRFSKTDATLIWDKLTEWGNAQDDDEAKQKARDAGCTKVVLDEWDAWYPDLLAVSGQYRAMLIEAVIDVPALEQPFKVFYVGGQTQFCPDAKTRFNQKALV